MMSLTETIARACAYLFEVERMSYFQIADFAELQPNQVRAMVSYGCRIRRELGL